MKPQGNRKKALGQKRRQWPTRPPTGRRRRLRRHHRRTGKTPRAVQRHQGSARAAAMISVGPSMFARSRCTWMRCSRTHRT